MCTGRPPFRASRTMAVLKRVIEETPRPIREINAEVPEWLCDIIAKLHAKKPEERFQSAGEVAELLAKYLAELQLHGGVIPLDLGRADRRSGKDRPVRPRWSRRRRILAGVTATLLAGVVLAVIFWPRRDPGPRAPSPNEVNPNIDRPAARAATRPFVILARDASPEQEFATLAKAVAAAGWGDTIEIRGDGPFPCGPIKITGKDLWIRAAPGFRPRLTHGQRKAVASDKMIETDSSLVLEGLDLHHVVGKIDGTWSAAVSSRGAPIISIASCRFVIAGYAMALRSSRSTRLQVLNCEFLGGWFGAIECIPRFRGQVSLENSLVHSRHGLELGFQAKMPGDVSVVVRGNTLHTEWSLGFWFYSVPTDKGEQPVRLHSQANLFSVESTMLTVMDLSKGGGVPVAQVEPLLRRWVHWSEESNVYPNHLPFLMAFRNFKHVEQPREIRTLAEWNKHWDNRGKNLLQGRIRYEGGDRLWEPDGAVEHLTRLDFRLAAGSPGKGAGPGGKDLGADVDLVGPGAAYERWKKTPAYQQWRKTTAQAMGQR